VTAISKFKVLPAATVYPADIDPCKMLKTSVPSELSHKPVATPLDSPPYVRLTSSVASEVLVVASPESVTFGWLLGERNEGG